MNQCQLMGRLVRDPELKYTPQGTAVTSFTLAVDRRFNRDKADYINIIAWRQTAEFVAKHFAKGQRVAVVGSIQTRSWEDNDGGKHKAVEIVADSVYFADAKKESAAGSYAESAMTSEGFEVTDEEFRSENRLGKGGEDTWTNPKKAKSEQGSWKSFGTMIRKRVS